MVNDIAVQDFVNAIKEQPTDTNTTYSATVSRIDDEGVVWVNLYGSDKETPTASTSTEVEKGDTVDVSWRNNRLYIAGNYSNPSAGLTTVNRVENVANTAQATADVAFVAANNAVADAARAATAADAAEADAARAAQQATNAAGSAAEAAASASSAQQSATSAGENASRAQAASEAAQVAALGSITTDTLHYLATSQSSGVTKNTSGWTTTVQAMTETNKYLWTYHTYSTAGGTSTDTTPVITGVYGQTGTAGDDGATIWTTTTAPTTPNYTFTISNLSGATGQTPKVGDLIVYSYYRYTISSVATTTVQAGSRVSIRGAQGADGDDGVSITSVQPQYYLHTSSTATQTEINTWNWSLTLTYVPGKFIWTRDYISYSDNTHGTSQAIYNEALTQSCRDAAEALGLIEEQQEYFWHDSLGAHVLSDKDTVSGVRYRTDIKGAGLEIFELNGQTDTSVAKFGATLAQVGASSTGHTNIASSGMQIYGGDGTTQLANIGYGRALNESGTYVNAPFYTLGQRALSYPGLNEYPVGTNSLVVGSGVATKASATAFNSSYALGEDSHSEGSSAVASGYGAHAEGYTNHTSADSNGYVVSGGITASGDGSHAEGYAVPSSGQSSWDITASGNGSHAEGYASEGYGHIKATGKGSHAQNAGTQALSDFQTAIGRCNEADANDKYAFIVGNGADNYNRSNAFAVEWNGNVESAGTITDGSGNVLSDKADSSSLATVATSGNYSDLSNKPTNSQGQYVGLYKITQVPKTLSTGCNANSYIAAADISMTEQTGYNAVGIVGHASSNFRVQPTTNYVKSNTALYAGFSNVSDSNVTSSVTITFYVLWLKATSG